MDTSNSATTPWLNHRVAFTGRLGSVTREQARQIVVDRAGTYAADVSRLTTTLIVGESGLPVNAKGRLTRKLERAHTLRRHGVSVDILNEQQFLDKSGLTRRDVGAQLFSLADVVNLTSTSRDRLRGLIRTGLIQPSTWLQDVPFFNFADVRLLQDVLQCLERGIGRETLRRTVLRLRDVLPSASASLTALSSVEIDGRRIILRSDDGTQWESTGQKLFSFDEWELAPTLELPVDLFAEALRCESLENWSGAARAYEELLLQDGPDAEIYFHLSNVLFEQQQLAAATERLRQSVELEPDYVEAWNNLGNVLALRRQYAESIRAYEQALYYDPDWHDARYGLADVLDESGRSNEANAHWKLLSQAHPVPEYAHYAQCRLRASAQS